MTKTLNKNNIKTRVLKQLFLKGEKMPQKAKFSKKEIIEKSIQIVEEEGIENLTARNLAKRLNSSARPIFTTFKNMDEVIDDTLKQAESIYQSYVEKGLSETLAFKGVGLAYIAFATDHPKLFALLFMKPHTSVPDLERVLGQIDNSYEKILASITNSYNVDKVFAKQLYQHLWIYSHGIAVLVATKMCKFSQSEIADMLTAVFKSLLLSKEKI